MAAVIMMFLKTEKDVLQQKKRSRGVGIVGGGGRRYAGTGLGGAGGGI